MLLTHPHSNEKLSKSEIPTWGISLLPHKLSGYNVCPHASAECSRLCLNTAGKGQLNMVQQARLRRTKLFFEDREEFFNQLKHELLLVWKKRKETKLFRWNILSDIDYVRRFPEMADFVYGMNFTSYDYTKDISKARRHLESTNPVERDYRLTFSRSENNWEECLTYLAAGGNVAVVFSTKRGEALPSYYEGYQVIDGDLSDDRSNDPYGVIVGLRYKGAKSKKSSPFVIQLD